ncbi:MAG TPA: NHL repeat-containing protein [Solirubrobacterales bacterium]|jgi:DNA-binding beta-propeller fold protein YncE|nr:NHL repeat-containing protein [Solirubrobacterales bacterium]
MLRSRSIRFPLLALFAFCAALLAPAGAGAAIGELASFGGFDPKAGAGKLRAPQGLALGSEAELYVAEESSNRISVFTAAGAFVRAFGRDVGGTGVNVCTTFCQEGTLDYPASTTAGAMSQPVDLAVDGSGRVFVSDHGNARVDVFTGTGSFLYAFGKDVKPGGGSRCDAGTECKEGEFDEAAGAFRQLEGIGIGGAALYAADGELNRVTVYSLEGTFLFAFGKNVNGGAGNPDVCTTSCQEGEDEGTGSLDYPTDVAVGPDGNVYVAYNGLTSGVAVFTTQGAFLRRFGDSGPQALDGASALTLDATGAAHVVDEVTEEVKTFSATGTFVSGFAAEGAAGLARDCRGAFFVSDYDGGLDSSKVRRYGEPGTALPPCPPPATPILVTVTPSNIFKFGKLKLNKQKGTATLVVKLPAPGKLTLKGNGLVRATKNAQKAGDVKLTIKPKGKVKKKLNELGKAVAKARLTFTPTGGTAATKQKSLTLKKALG